MNEAFYTSYNMCSEALHYQMKKMANQNKEKRRKKLFRTSMTCEIGAQQGFQVSPDVLENLV